MLSRKLLFGLCMLEHLSDIQRKTHEMNKCSHILQQDKSKEHKALSCDKINKEL